MKPLTNAGWLKTLIITCLASSTISSFSKVNNQFSSSLEFYTLGRFGIKDLN